MAQGKSWSPELEGLRGLASLWVLLGHICLLVQCRIPLLYDPGMGVDLFILLSGFLMAKNYMERRDIEPWTSSHTIRNFWLRRFFRIAPLYYFLLLLALIFGAAFGEWRDVIAQAWPSTQTESQRYADTSVGNILAHISFVFGAIPYYSFRTVLPDWSIGLEMQFYVLFPFIMLLVMRWGFFAAAFAVMVGCFGARWAFPGYFEAFPMPSMILIKLPLFVAGMLIAAAVRDHRRLLLLLAFLAPVLAWQMHIAVTPVRLIAQCVMIAGLGALLWQAQAGSLLHQAMRLPRWLLTRRISQFLGDVSYSVYLLHLMIVIPVIGLLVEHSAFEQHASPVRLLIAAAISLPVTYGLATVLFHRVEKPGIALGKRLITRKPVQPEQVMP
ncbi:acyltransferase family protein [Cronobacter turicensis]|uniref:acyltransferase family protein n=1 Tax=Cronobacter turicensis TaxID=413502 RepID=UPI0024AF967C|nr:acyltransferase [Cronobacter turicensis]ELY5828458.1 acyltransferase [Cronobacter turicensis]EMA4137341.1 acyltransferase [Cronobacter turicensis]MDI7404865.1 acyltransferase [Cronobacter turicensis]MDI7417482.1 acyltransferase [Cronobacter turicensis]MDI7497128.1 acyltransferase [Cronobacter turicensis]